MQAKRKLPRPPFFSSAESVDFYEKEYRREVKRLIDQFNELLSLPFSHFDCKQRKQQIIKAQFEESLLDARCNGYAPPWKSYPSLCYSDVDLATESQKSSIRLFSAYYLSLSKLQRIRMRKRVREPKHWKGFYTMLEYQCLSKVPKDQKKTLDDYLSEKNGLSSLLQPLTTPECKVIADRYYEITGHKTSNLIVYRNGSIARVFSDVEEAALKEGLNACSDFRHHPDQMQICEVDGGYLCQCAGLSLLIANDQIPAGIRLDSVLQWYAGEKMTADALSLQPMLFYHGSGFVNLDQKRSFIRMDKRESKKD